MVTVIRPICKYNSFTKLINKYIRCNHFNNNDAANHFDKNTNMILLKKKKKIIHQMIVVIMKYDNIYRSVTPDHYQNIHEYDYMIMIIDSVITKS